MKHLIRDQIKHSLNYYLLSYKGKNIFHSFYDDFGRTSLIKKYLPDSDQPDEITTIERVYDTHNNWIQAVQYVDGVPVFFAEREIEYLK